MKCLSVCGIGLWLCFFAGFAANTAAKTELDTVIETKQSAQQTAKQMQQKIVTVDDQTNEIVAEYRQLLRENRVLDTYNRQLRKQLSQQDFLLAELDKNMADVRATRMAFMPLLQEMVQVLRVFVDNDLPFLWQERQLRLQELGRLLDDPNIALADKYRRVLEAYQIEAEYGATIERWNAVLPKTTEQKAVQLIRVGRLALYYLTPDRTQAGYWDNIRQIWSPLPDSWLAEIIKTADVAENKVLPDLLTLPLRETR